MPSEPTDVIQAPDAVPAGELTVSIETLSRNFAAIAMSALVRIVQSPRDFPANAVVNAANSILDRAYGKPTQAVVQVPAKQALAQRMAQMSDDDLVRLVNGEQPAARPDAPAALPDPQALALQALNDALAAEALSNEKEAAENAKEARKKITRTPVGKKVAARQTADRAAARAKEKAREREIVEAAMRARDPKRGPFGE